MQSQSRVCVPIPVRHNMATVPSSASNEAAWRNPTPPLPTSGFRPIQLKKSTSPTLMAKKLAISKSVKYGKTPFLADREVLSPSCGKSKQSSTSLLPTNLKLPHHSKPFKCDLCSRSFSHKSTLNVHNRSHTGERPYSCSICSRSFSRRSYLIRHSRSHTGEKPFSCEICHQRFSQKANCVRHIGTHQNRRPFECQKCPKAFAKNASLQSHIMKMHWERSAFDYSPSSVSSTNGNTLQRYTATPIAVSGVVSPGQPGGLPVFPAGFVRQKKSSVLPQCPSPSPLSQPPLNQSSIPSSEIGNLPRKYGSSADFHSPRLFSHQVHYGYGYH